MRWLQRSFFIMTVLVAGVGAAQQSSDGPYRVAWGERVTVPAGTAFVDVTYLGTSSTHVVTTNTFDIPLPDGAPDLDAEASVSIDTYRTPLKSEPYTQRGSVTFLNAQKQTIATLSPYGSTESGRVTLIASIINPCDTFISQTLEFANEGVPAAQQFMLVDDVVSVSLSETVRLCQATFEMNQQGTQQALSNLSAALRLYPGYQKDLGVNGFVLERNIVTNLDPPVKSFDPSCEQIRNWLDPLANKGAFEMIDIPGLQADTNTLNAARSGAGVRVIVIGGGIASNDSFSCGNAFYYHDSHIVSIVRNLAPDVSITALTACNAAGDCKNNTIQKALLRVINTLTQNPNAKIIINASWGGPLASQSDYALFNLLGERYNVMIVASGGNHPHAPAHYPASYDNALTHSTPALSNVIAVAATGKTPDGYAIAGFNTRNNSSVFAAGVSLCPVTAALFRCDVAGVYPDDLGVTGSSFAVASVSAVLALYLEDAPVGVSTGELKSCLLKGAALSPLFEGLVWFDAAACQ